MYRNLNRSLGIGLAAILVTAASVASAQAPGWEKVKRDGEATPTTESRTRTGESPTLSDDGKLTRMVNVQVGYPLVLAPRYFFPVTENSQVGAGAILLPGLVGITGEFRRYLVPPRIQKFSWYLDGGLTLYSIRSKDRVSSPLGFHVGTGTLYRTTSPFALGGEIGYMGLSGSSKSDPIKSYGLEAGKSTMYVNFQVSYLF